jgi:hypothetical protein
LLDSAFIEITQLDLLQLHYHAHSSFLNQTNLTPAFSRPRRRFHASRQHRDNLDERHAGAGRLECVVGLRLTETTQLDFFAREKPRSARYPA